MNRRLQLCLLLAAAVVAYAQRSMTADQVIVFIRSSIQLHNDDRQVADFIKKIKLSDKLEARKVEELQGMGAGPRTVIALRELSTASANLSATAPPPPPPPRPVIPPPDSVEQARILQETIDKARDYAKTLPDYMCIQVTRRHDDPTGTENWRMHDTIQEQLSYVDQKETYTVTMINGRAVTNMDHDALGGSTSSGEFGSIYSEIFAPDTATEFAWDHWATLRGHRMYVWAFHVPKARSHYTIYEGETKRTVTAGYRGLLYVDRDSMTVMRYRLECEEIPADFPVKDIKLDVNYDFTEIAGTRYVLPLKTEIRSRMGRYQTWNESEFHLYRKFGADTSISFDTPDPISDDKTQETPATPDPKDTKPPVKKQPQ